MNGVNGEFRCRELTAIVGPSGAGKSTLLDILTGYTTNITNGSISINGQPRDLKQFRRQTTYILQNNYLHMHITVWEAMFFSINLKIGDQLNDVEKQERVSKMSIKIKTLKLIFNQLRLDKSLKRLICTIIAVQKLVNCQVVSANDW